MMVGYHGHASTGPEHWEESFTFAKHNGANLDIGHFVGGQKTSPVPFLKKHHDRITHIHVKDKKFDNKNVPFGQGDTPVKEVLQTIRDNKWPIQATIEFEYRCRGIRSHEGNGQVSGVLQECFARVAGTRHRRTEDQEVFDFR